MDEPRDQVDTHQHHAHSYVEARLGRWGHYQRWLNRAPGAGGGMPAPIGSWWGQVILTPNVQGRGSRQPPLAVVCPLTPELRAEAGETGLCIAALDHDLQAVIVEAYYWQPKVDEQVAALGCCKQTYYNRLRRAHTQLLGLFLDAAAGLPIRPE